MGETIEKVRLLVLPKKDSTGKPLVTIPKQLNDPYLKTTVELNPDAMVSKQFGEAYVKTYEGYKIIPDSENVSREDYLINENYREPEIAQAVDNLSPAKKDVVYEFVKFITDKPEDEVVKMGEDLKRHAAEMNSINDNTDKEIKEKVSDEIKKQTNTGGGSGQETGETGTVTKDGNPVGGSNVTELNPGADQLAIEKIMLEKGSFTVQDIAQATGREPMNVGKDLKALLERGFLTKNDKTFTLEPGYKKILEDKVNAGSGGNGSTN